MNRRDIEALAVAVKRGWPLTETRREAAARLAIGLALGDDCKAKFLKACGVINEPS